MVVNDEDLVKAYLSALGEPFKKQIVARLKRIADHGPPNNEEIFKHIEGPIYEIKTHTGVRILCFFCGSGRLMLTQGFFKQRKRIFNRDVKRAIGWHREYYEPILERLKVVEEES